MTHTIRVRATIRFLSASEGGRTAPVVGGHSYRPIHNFFGAENREMVTGPIDLPAGTNVEPGASVEVTIGFFCWEALEGELYPGREWRLQEGAKLVAIGKVIEVFPPD